MHPNTEYSFWVEGCNRQFLAKSACSPWEGPEQIDTGPGGAPDACVQGYVWREAVSQDHVCVTPGTRNQAAYDNSEAQQRVAR